MQVNKPSLWSYITKLKPQLRGHVQIYDHLYRGELWYILHDKSSGQYLRLSERAYSIVGRLDGNHSLEEVYEYANEFNAKHPLTTDEIMILIGQLNAAELLRDALPIDAQDVFQQYKAQKQKKSQRTLMNPFSIKIPLLDPDDFLNLLSPFARFLFSPLGFWIWISTLASAFVLALQNSEHLMYDIRAIELSSTQIISLWLVYPLIKAIHEIAHGLALKVWGAQVHEAGVNLLLLMPVPYVDATASLGFKNKWKRMTVGAAGISAELFLASIALFLYLLVEPGFIKESALNVILIATLSTLLFNGNPLLRYDGYFVFEDWLEIPNLATRSKLYYSYLVKRYLLKMQEVHSPVTALGEKKWFLFYGFISPLYRLVILFTIAIYLSDSFFVVGIVLAIWIIFMQFVAPLIKALQFLSSSQLDRPYRKRGVQLIFASIVAVIFILFIPFPSTTYTQGVVSTIGNSQLTTAVSGFVTKLCVPSGTQVKAGQTLLKLEDPELRARYQILEAKIKELEVRISEQLTHSRVRAEIFRDDLHSTQSEFALVSKQIQELTLNAQSDGQFILVGKHNPLGQYFQQGKIVAYIISPKNLIIKAVIPQSRIGLLQEKTTTAEIILTDRVASAATSKIIHETPQAINYLPSSALGSSNGGDFQVLPDDKSGTHLQKAMFQIDLEVPKELKLNSVGERIYVRLHHGYIPLGEQLGFYLNQLFLRHFYFQ